MPRASGRQDGVDPEGILVYLAVAAAVGYLLRGLTGAAWGVVVVGLASFVLDLVVQVRAPQVRARRRALKNVERITKEIRQLKDKLDRLEHPERDALDAAQQKWEEEEKKIPEPERIRDQIKCEEKLLRDARALAGLKDAEDPVDPRGPKGK